MVESSSAFLLQPGLCASLWFRLLGSPAQLFRSSSAMVTLPLLIPIVPFLSPPAPLKVFEHLIYARIAPHILPRLDPSQGGFRWGADAMAFSLVDSLRLRRHEHTFAAFIDIKKASNSCWVEATLVRLFDFGVTGSLWHLLAKFLCGTLSQVRLAGCVTPPWVDSGIAQGRILSPLLFNLLVDSLAATLRSAIPGVPRIASDPFHHVCQLYADDLVILTASQADLQVAFNAVHAWGVRWRFSFGIVPFKSAVMIFGPLRSRPDCCAHQGSVPLPLVQQYRYLGVVLSPTLSWRPHVDFICSRGDRLFHQASAWCLGEGLPLSFSSSVFVSSSFGLEFIADDPPALQQFNLALCRWCRHLLGWPSASAVAAVYWELGIGDALHLALGRAFSPVRCRPRLSSSSGYCQCFPALFRYARHLVALVPTHSSLSLHPAPWPRGYFSWLSALVTPSVVLPRSQSSSVPCPSSQTLCHGV